MNKGLVASFNKRLDIAGFEMTRGTVVTFCIMFLIVSHAVMFTLGTVYGWDRGYAAAIREISQALKEQSIDKRSFKLRGIEARFHPRTDNQINYTIAGAGADTPVRGEK
jgi:hypothetical protein